MYFVHFKTAFPGWRPKAGNKEFKTVVFFWIIFLPLKALSCLPQFAWGEKKQGNSVFATEYLAPALCFLKWRFLPTNLLKMHKKWLWHYPFVSRSCVSCCLWAGQKRLKKKQTQRTIELSVIHLWTQVVYSAVCEQHRNTFKKRNKQ